MIFWRLFAIVSAFCCFTEALIAAFHFEHVGDMHIAWASNSVIACGFWLWQAVRGLQ